MPAQVSMLAKARETSQRESVELSPTSLEEGSQDNDAITGNENGDTAQKKTRKRIRHFTSGDRAAHRVFERARREAFREKLIELAELLPTLKEADASRLSKHTVVHESIARHQEQMQQIDTLTRERDELQAEVARWRAQARVGSLGGLSDPAVSVSFSGSDADLSPAVSLSMPLSLPLTMPNAAQLPTVTATDLVLGPSSLELPLDELPQSLPDNGWSWDTPFDFQADVCETEAPLPWGGLDDADIGRLVVSSMVSRTDVHRETEDVIVVNTSGLDSGMIHSSEQDMRQMLWMVSS
ncbi:hypothetical protein SBRCBS47491_001807 [Sporothrix bragantina]|uniref:BHLH domain-containing protein n=1 Tax=Sporothrix bragantina TaxID=671064 RepID=A0ABP0B1R7_9PEZI